MTNRTDLDLGVLRSFVAGVELGSFAQASTRVGRSQSAVSAQLRKLEDQSGRPLLRKAGRGLALTEAGEVMLGYARRLLELNDEAVAAIHGVDLDGWVRLGLPQDFAEGWLPGILGRFARAHPGIRVEVVAGRNAELMPKLRAGALDMALAWGEPDGPHAERLTELRMAWIGPADGAVSRRAGDVPLVVFEPPCRFRTVAMAALDAARIPWRVSFTSPGLSGLWAAAAAGLGISLRTPVGLPAGVRALEPREGGLPGLPRVALSLHHAGATPTPAVARLAAILREAVLESMPAHGPAR